MSSIVIFFFIKVSVPAPFRHRYRFKSIGYVPVAEKTQTIPIPTYEPPPVSAAPILLVLPTQPQAPSVLFRGPSCSQSFVPPAPTVKAFMPNKSSRPCGACHVPKCGRQRKRDTHSKDT